MSKAKQKELINVLSGKASEPKHTGLVYTRSDLIKALNHYSAHAKHDDLKAWSLDYLKKNHPELVKHVSKAPTYKFTTFGALCRMDSRGFKHDEEMQQRIFNFFNDLKVEEVESSPKPKAPKKVKTNASLENFEYAVDDMINGSKEMNFALSAADSMQPIIEACNLGLQEIKDNPDDFLKDTARVLKKFYKVTIERLQKVKEQKKKRITKVRKAKPATVIKNVKFQREDTELGIQSISPIDVLGKRKMYVFNTKYRRLFVFNSTGPGFTFSGTTLQNVDMERSTFKTVRDPKALLKDKPGMAELNKAYGALKTKESAVTTTRFSPYSIILRVA